MKIVDGPGHERFRDRADAGRRLADLVASLRHECPVVFALPRGGVPVGAEVARRLGAPLDVLVVRKVGHPQQRELAIGAIAEGGLSIIDWERADRLGARPGDVHTVVAQERAELDRRIVRYRGARPRTPVEGREVVLVDDGLATGATARVAVAALRRAGARAVIVAAPVAPLDTIEEMRAEADGVVCVVGARAFDAVGQWYEDFRQVTDDEVASLLAEWVGGGPPEAVEVIAGARLPGMLTVPDDPIGFVLFAHGSGSSRLSPRNQRVAAALNRVHISTLLFDLLTEDEAAQRENVFDVNLLGERLVAATRWATATGAAAVPAGIFGASTGAAAALIAAGELGRDVSAVVSRGGRPDLADGRLPVVTAPTLLIVGGRDPTVLDLNRRAAARLTHCEHRLVVVPGATHLFEEAGALETVSTLAADWFTTHFRAHAESRRAPA